MAHDGGLALAPTGDLASGVLGRIILVGVSGQLVPLASVLSILYCLFVCRIGTVIGKSPGSCRARLCDSIVYCKG